MLKNSILILFAAVFLISCGKEEVEKPFTKSEFQEITSLNQYDSTIKSGVSLMFFHTTWCSICKTQRPKIIELLSDSSLSKVSFGEVDKEKNLSIVNKYQVANQPVIILYKDNVEMHRLSGGGHTTADLASLLKDLKP